MGGRTPEKEGGGREQKTPEKEGGGRKQKNIGEREGYVLTEIHEGRQRERERNQGEME